MQVPSQSVRPVWQVRAHAPLPLHTSPAAQVFDPAPSSQPPQLPESTSVSVQTPAQSVRPAWQVTAHTPLPAGAEPGLAPLP